MTILARWPAIIMILWFAFTIGCEALVNGRPRAGKHNIKPVAAGILGEVAILYFGGFWG